MRELLPNNTAHAERLEALPLYLGHPTKQAVQREVGSLITWVSSFTAYVTIVTGTGLRHAGLYIYIYVNTSSI
jgi:hypothetical protein